MDQFQRFDISDFFDQFKAPLFLMDEEEVIYVNTYCKENFGPLPDNWREFFSSEEALAKLESFFETGQDINAKIYQTLISKDGTELSYNWDFTNLPSSYQGRFLVAKGEKREVIPEKPAMFLSDPLAYTMEEIQYLRTILNNTHDLIAILDLDGNYKFISPSVGEKLGFSVNDIIGRNYRDFLSMGVLGVVKGDYQAIAKTDKEVNIDFWIRGMNGRKIYIESFAKNLTKDPYVQGVLFSARDITDFVKTKESLRKSEEKYRTLVEESTEIIFSLSEKYELTYVSPNVTQFLGYSSEEVMGTSIFDYLNPEDLGAFQEMVSVEVDFLAKNQFLEFRLKHKDGTFRVFNSNGKLIEHKDRSGRYYTGIARDISKLKETQHALIMEKERAEQASMVKSQFLSIMSHEIRTPLNAVVGMSHFLMHEDPRPDQLENLKTLQFSAENLTGLINDILDYSKIESGKIELEFVSFDLRTAVSRLVHSYTFQASEKDLELKYEIDESLPDAVIGDPIRIGQIVNNLISNAIKFTERGEICLHLKTVGRQEGQIQVEFVCSDTGIGIAEDKKQAIFEAFTQASTDTTRKYGGTGLGLTIVRRLIELHGSEIEVRSKPEGGTEFIFELSFAVPQKKIEAMSEDGRPASKSLQDAAILVAEDNMVNQILIKKFLTKWNTGKLVLVSDGKEALEVFAEQNFDLVLLDLQMPLVDGFEVAENIRNHPDPTKQSTPILALTASSIHEIREQLERVGIDDYVPKPFTPEGLYDKLLGQLKKQG